MWSLRSSSSSDLEVVSLWPSERLEVVGTVADSPARLTYRFEATETGTRLINEIELEPHGVLRLVAPLLSTRIEQAVVDNLEELKNVLETAA